MKLIFNEFKTVVISVRFHRKNRNRAKIDVFPVTDALKGQCACWSDFTVRNE
jgi:hypothetical protein